MSYTVKLLSESDLPLLKALNTFFGEAFDEPETYQKHTPTDEYLLSLLSKPHFIALAALQEKEVVGGIAAYELEKFEQERSEIYIYDLAVDAKHRRKGIATEMINELKRIARDRNAYVIYVQADRVDAGAIQLYESLGSKEEVLHFDISVD